MKKNLPKSGSAELTFNDVLPDLAVLYRQGVLVPFIGSGMSLPTCTNWLQFLKNLATNAGVEISDNAFKKKGLDALTLYRFADQTVEAIRPMKHLDRTRIYRDALRAWTDDEKPSIPRQTISLASLFWPLVLSTNYDDLYWGATGLGNRPYILGRSIDDCHLVLRSLDETFPPILWALQGFVGGQISDFDVSFRNPNRQRELLNQIVVGHQQYQRAINSEVHFRRAFAEVFRRRSLLFLGSGLLEDYLINLFSEIIHHHGPGPYPHFAMVSVRDRNRFSSSFLQTRLGVVPVFYKDHLDMPQHLDELSDLVNYWPGSKRSISVPKTVSLQFHEIGFALLLTRSSAQPMIKIRISKSPLPLPAASECSVVSVGRRKNVPLVGSQAEAHIETMRKAQMLDADQEWLPLDTEPSYLYRYGSTSVFGVAARSKELKGHNHDRRDLGVIPTAICEALARIDSEGFEVVNIGPIASGKNRPWHPIHPFAQTLRGIRRFTNEIKVCNIRVINLFVVDPAVWYPVVARKIPIAELLTSALTTHRVDMIDDEGSHESFAVTLRESPTLKEVLSRCNINRERWKVSFSPSRTDAKQEPEPSDDQVVSPTMTIILTPH